MKLNDSRTRIRWLEWGAGLALLALVAGIATLIYVRQQATQRLVQVLASEYADLSLLRREIRLGADVNTRGAWGNALSQACEGGDASLVRDLISRGAHLEGEPSAFPPPLAYCSGHPEITRILLEHGANPNARPNGTPIIQWFLSRGDLESMRVLIEHGADPAAKDSFGLAAFDYVDRGSAEGRKTLTILKQAAAHRPDR